MLCCTTTCNTPTVIVRATHPSKVLEEKKNTCEVVAGISAGTQHGRERGEDFD